MNNNPFIDKKYLYVVVGRINNLEDLPVTIISQLQQLGYPVVSVAGIDDQVNGIRTYESLMTLDERPDVVVFAKTEGLDMKSLIRDCVDGALTKYWFQPQLEVNQKLIDELVDQGLEVSVSEDICAEL